jgi:tellurite methyltransferase
VSALASQFGDIDIYLFDQLLRGRMTPEMRVLDAGCGWGRNLVFFLQNGYDVAAVDADANAVAAVRSLAGRLAPHLPAQNFRTEPIEEATFPDASADIVISSAVLHFARDDAHFHAMLGGSWRILAPGGLFFCRLASSIGLEDRVQPIGSGRFRLPDGSDRYLVDEPRLLELTRQLNATLADPIKTTIVQNQRSMTTWVLRK